MTKYRTNHPDPAGDLTVCGANRLWLWLWLNIGLKMWSMACVGVALAVWFVLLRNPPAS